MHTPVLLQQVIKSLNIKKSGKYIDATGGSGGHAQEILKSGCKLLIIEIDNFQVKNLKKNILGFQNNKNLKIVNNNYSKIKEIAQNNNFCPVDGILFDLGLSYDQIKSSNRGFSFKNKLEILDMRLSKAYKICAADIINSFNETELYEIFAKYSEEINSRTISKSIIRARYMKKISTVGDLTEIIDSVLKRHDERVLSRIFQALRMYVNNDLENLKKALIGSLEILKVNGRLLVITFHSVEDRIVKNFIKNNKNLIYQFDLLQSDNSKKFERSSKLRILIKK